MTEPNKDVKYRRQQRRGYPPVTPNACAKDAVVSQLFDQAWGEVCTCTWIKHVFCSHPAMHMKNPPTCFSFFICLLNIPFST